MAAIRYMVDKVDKAVEFYTKHLGFTMKEDWGPVAVLTRDNLELWLSGPSSSAGKTLVNGISAVAGGANRFVLVVKEMESLLNNLKKAGVSFGSDVVRGPAGSWVIVMDPAGNPVELFEPK